MHTKSEMAEQACLEMIRKGATKGMIRAHFKKQAIETKDLDLLYARLVKRHALEIRKRGLTAFVAGLAMVVVGFGVIFTLANNGMPHVPIGLRYFLLFLIGAGFVTAFKGFFDLSTGAEG